MCVLVIIYIVYHIIFELKYTHHFKLAGLGNMDCGKDMQNYILIKTWFTLLALVTTVKIGSMPKLPGTQLQDSSFNCNLFEFL